MFKQMIEKIKNTFKNLDKKIIKILKYSLKLCFLITILSIGILVTYLFFIHSYIIFQIGILVFQVSIYYSVYCIISAITVDSIQKQLL